MDREIRDILDLFTEINKIPRQSKHEKQISDWLMTWAEKNGFAAKRDNLLNVLIHVPPTPGYEKRPVVVLQGHMDMVCEKTPDSPHDFSKDPVKVLIDEDWVHADKTTLGADNAIALAMAMKIAIDPAVEHPELELLFTIDEETGLTGANGLSSDFIKGKILLNIDSEDDKKFTIGCAGGRDTKISFPVEFISNPEAYSLMKISVSGLTGGHSGSDIHKSRANANKILARVLDRLDRDDIYLVTLTGGSAHNAIPRDAEALLAIPRTDSSPLSRIESLIQDLQHEYQATDPNLIVSWEEISRPADQVLTRDLTKRIIQTLLALPHGVAAMSSQIDGLVETSNNLATLKTDSKKITLLTSQRSSVMSRLDVITRQIESVGHLAGAEVRSGNGYPSWQPDMNSKLLKKCKEVYRKVHDGEEPVIEVIHAGLECGVIGAKYDGMEMISFGPLILDAHSPDERMSLPSLEKVWSFTKTLLKEL